MHINSVVLTVAWLGERAEAVLAGLLLVREACQLDLRLLSLKLIASSRVAREVD